MRLITVTNCCLSFIIALIPASALSQVSVGWETSCDYDVTADPQALQTALDAGHAEIRLTHQNDYAGVIDITQNVYLRGGYADCAAANNDNQTTTRAVLDGSGQERAVLRMDSVEGADIQLELLTIRNGDGTLANQPGGLEIKNLTGQVALDQLDIRDNIGATGGGIAIDSNSALKEGALNVVITDTAIRDNVATRGGGLSCDTFHSAVDIQLHLSGGTTLRDNHATVGGGAIHMQSCQLDFEAGIANTVVGSNLEDEIFRNTSQTSGAGLALFDTARVILRGNPEHAFDLSNNEGNLDQSTSGAGGAAQVGSDAELEIVNGNITGNSSGRYGGALFASFGGKILVRRDPAGCSYGSFCSRIVGNRLTGTFPGGGGALAARFGGEISVYNTLFWLNSSDEHGYIGYAESQQDGQDATLHLEGNVIYDNAQISEDSNPTAVHLRAESRATLAYNTFFRNKAQSIILSQSSDSSLKAVGNILDEPGNIHQASGTVDTEINCNLVRSLDSIETAVIDTFEGTPDYVDTSSQDFRLAADDTVAIDVCSTTPYTPGVDMGGQPRGLDRVDVIDLNGPFDLGAYEFNPAALDQIFSDVFEQGL